MIAFQGELLEDNNSHPGSSHRSGLTYINQSQTQNEIASNFNYGVKGDTHGTIKGNAAKNDFKRHSRACPGYRVDHVRALEHGERDSA